MFFSRGGSAALPFPFVAAVWLALCAFGVPAEGSYGVWWGGGGPLLVTLDPEGNRTSVVEPKGQTTAFEYDELGKLTKVTQPAVPLAGGGTTTPVTRYVYDPNRNRVKQTDANEHVVEMAYDELNRMKSMTQDPGGFGYLTVHEYDENGNEKKLTDPKKQVVSSTYDELNRLKTKDYAFAPSDPVRPWRHTTGMVYTYDPNNNLVQVDESMASGNDPPETQTTIRDYDDLDRLTKETSPLPDGGTKAVAYTYFGNGTRKTVTDPAGLVTGYAYDGQNRLQTATTNFGTPQAKATTYSYFPDDLLKTVTYPNGVVANHDYDKADRLTSLTNTKAGTTSSGYVYEYDANGNRKKQIETNGLPTATTEETTYSYDALNRLALVNYPDKKVGYGYDAVGNRTSEVEKGITENVLSSKLASFDAVNRLSSIVDSVAPVNNAAFTWNPNGNQLTKTTAGKTTEYRYDVRDKLVEVGLGGSILGRFQYDFQGRRNKKIGEEGIRQYVYDQTSLLTEYDENATQKAKYDYGSDRLISLFRSDEGRRYFSFDGLGSVASLTDDPGTTKASYHLDAFGQYRIPTELDASKNRFGLTGHYFDRETNLYFAKARYLDPQLGRFISQDTFTGQIDEPPSLHRYFYANANPLRYVDPSGNVAIIDNLVGGVVSVGIGLAVSKFMGKEYSWKDAAVDFGLGLASSGLSSLKYLKYAKDAGVAVNALRLGGRVGAQYAVGFTGEVARQELTKGKVDIGEASQGAVAGALIGEAGAVAGRGVGRFGRYAAERLGASESETGQFLARDLTSFLPKGLQPPNLSQGQKTAVLQESAQGHGEPPMPGENVESQSRPAGDSAVPPPPESRGPPGASADEAGAATSATPSRGAVRWVDENGSMSQGARDYQAGAVGSRSNVATRAPQAPEVGYRNAAGEMDAVRFDGQEGTVLIDRKTSVTTFPKSQNQALRQAEALSQNGLTGRWEVPTAAEKVRADRMFQRLGINNIDVKVVPKQ